MAIADFLQCLMFTVTGIGTSIQHNYPMGGFWCRSDTFLKYWFLNVSQLSLIALSVDRVTGIFKPFWKKLTPSVTAFVCLTLWIVSLLITLWLAFYRSLAHREWSDFSEVLCYETDVDQAIWVTFTAVLVYLPVVSMLLFYNLILLRLRQLRRRFPDNESIDTQQATIMKMIYFYLMSSLICWAPQQYLKYNRQFFHLQYTWPKWQREMYFVYHLFAALNAALNPIIYGMANETFRLAIKKFSFFKNRDDKDSDMIANVVDAPEGEARHEVGDPGKILVGRRPQDPKRGK